MNKQREDRLRKEFELEKLKQLTKKRMEMMEKIHQLEKGPVKQGAPAPPPRKNPAGERTKQLKELLDKKKTTVELAVAPCSPPPPLPGNRWKGGRGIPLPPKHSGLDSTPKAFPYPNPSPNRISNRQ